MPAFTPDSLRSAFATFSDARVCWIAFSGGMDSTVLLHAVAALRDRFPFDLRALHVDHGLHPGSPDWAAHCGLFCERLEVRLHILSLEVIAPRGESLEAVARERRYAAMAGFLGKGDLLLTAHHRDDQAETLLLALMRGSGPMGLAGMPRAAPLGEGRLVRPLLDFGRSELLEYARAKGLHWVEDPGNASQGFDRNFMRHRALPLLAQRWPSCATGIARSAGHCAEAQGLLDMLAQDELQKAAGQRVGTLSISSLRKLSEPLRKLVLRYWFRTRALAPPDSRHLQRILSEVMGARPDATPLVAWRGCEVRRYRDDLFALQPLPPSPGPEQIRWMSNPLALPAGLGRLRLSGKDGQALDPSDLTPEGLIVRYGGTGLSCRPRPGAHSRALKKIFQESGIPPWLRPYVPLVFLGGALVAVGDIFSCHPAGKAGEQRFRVDWISDLRLLF